MTGPVAPPPPRARRRVRWSVRLTALLLGLLLALLAAEAAFRCLWPLPAAFAEFQQAGLYTATADGDIALLPGYRGSLQVGTSGRRTAVNIDSLGLRGDEVPPRPPGGRRVLVVGDSMVFGYGVEAEQALPAALARELRAAGVQAQVGNAGVPGYGSRHMAAQVARLDGPFAPDAIVVCGCLGNDSVDDCSPRRTAFAGLQFQGPMAQLVQTSWRVRLAVRSRAALWLETWIFTNRPAWSPLLQAVPDADEAAAMRGLPGWPQQPGQTFAGLFLDAGDDGRRWDDAAPPVLPRLQQQLQASLQRIRGLAGARPVWFVVLPTLFQVDEPLRQATLRQCGFDPAEFPRGTAQRRWLAAAAAAGVVGLDATPVLAAAPGDHAALFIEDRGHFSAPGNALVARWLAAELAPRLR